MNKMVFFSILPIDVLRLVKVQVGGKMQVLACLQLVALRAVKIHTRVLS